jgi:hypothetical protein
MRVFFGTIILSSLLVLVSCGGAATSTSTTKSTLSGITLEPATAPAISLSGSVQVRATGMYQISATDFSPQDVTNSATWSTSNAAVATVNAGVVTGKAIGSVTITASLDGHTSSALVVVGQTPSVAVSAQGPAAFHVSSPNRQFQYIATYPDGSVLDLTKYATWSSSDAAVMKFFNDYLHDPGEALLVGTGMATVTATQNNGDVGILQVSVVQ